MFLAFHSGQDFHLPSFQLFKGGYDRSYEISCVRNMRLVAVSRKSRGGGEVYVQTAEYAVKHAQTVYKRMSRDLSQDSN